MSLEAAIRAAKTDDGEGLFEITQRAPTLLVFLRHFGCVFCREAVAEVAKQRQGIEEEGYQIVLVYQGPSEFAQQLFAANGIDDLPRVNDSTLHLYQAAGMGKGTWMDFLKPGLYARTLQALLRGFRQGMPRGDVSQLGGVILVKDGKLLAASPSKAAFEPLDFRILDSRGSIGES